ncbi:MAG: RNA 2'-phosphotransferase [Chloroflexota bacterium]
MTKRKPDGDKRLSKFLALMLRHEPDKFGINLDDDGFADAATVFDAIQKRYSAAYSYEDFVRVATTPAQDGKQRYEMDAAGARVRARYGHNQRVTAVTYEQVEPPAVLYHGAPSHVIDAIRAEGLTAQARQYVHMATTTERAVSVGARHGKPVLLIVRAADAHADGVAFYRADDEHYLAAAVPPAYIDFP